MQLQLLSGTGDTLRELVTVPARPAAVPRRDGPAQNAEQAKQMKRVGILIGLKLNMYKAAERLRFGYASEMSLLRMGISAENVRKLKNSTAKAEKLFVEQGGNRQHFVQAILKGEGNKDQKVPLERALAGVNTLSWEEQVLELNTNQLAQTLGFDANLGSTTATPENGKALASASDVLLKLGGIAQDVSAISTALGTATQRNPDVMATDTSAIKPQQAGISGWVGENKGLVTAGGGLLLLGFFITQMKHEAPAPDPPAKSKAKSAVKRKKKRARKTQALGFIPLS